VALLEILRRAISQPGVYVRIGAENEVPGLRSLSVVATGYGLAARKLGTVSLIGPVQMDYAAAIEIVRAGARELSRFAQEVY
jgi:heat-inducible transcriptional repressor